MKFHTLILALGLSAVVASAFAAGTGGDTKPNVDLSQARALIEKKDWNAAVSELERAVRADRDNADVHTLLGYSLRNAGKLERAISEYKTALRLDPQHKGAHEYFGVALLLAKQPDKARDHLDSLKKICGEGCEEYQDLAKAIAEYK